MGSKAKTSQRSTLELCQLPEQFVALGDRLHEGLSGTRPKRVSIQDVAKAAHVSTATVSRVANDATSVNEKMRRRVVTAMRELKYKANTQAIALVRDRSRLFGLVVPGSRNSFAAELIEHFQICALVEGQETMVCFYVDDDPTRCALRLREKRVEGAAVALLQMDDDLTGQLSLLGVPTVLVNTTSSAKFGSDVTIDYHAGMLDGVQYLAALGHRRIGFVPGALSQQIAQAQLESFLKSCQTVGIDMGSTKVLPHTHTLAGGHDVVARLIEDKEPPTAVCCSNVSASHGILQGIANRRGDLRRGLSLIACEDAPSCRLTAPSITAIGVEPKRLAEALLCQLMKLRNTESSKNAGSIVSTKLTVRSTTRPPF